MTVGKKKFKISVQFQCEIYVFFLIKLFSNLKIALYALKILRILSNKWRLLFSWKVT